MRTPRSCSAASGIVEDLRAQHRRRRHRLTPVVLPVILLVILALTACVAPGSAAGSPSPGANWYDVGGWSLPPHPAGWESYYHVARDHAGFIYVSDEGNNVVQKYSADGALLQTWGTGFGNMFLEPMGLACDTAGNLFVADKFNYRILRLSTSGVWSVFYDGGTTYCPYALTTDAAGDIYALLHNVMIGVNFVFKLSPDGAYLLGWAGFNDGDPGYIGWPGGITCDAQGQVFVSDYQTQRVKEFDGLGNPIRSWQPSSISTGLTVGLDGDVIVCEPNARLVEYSKEGTLLNGFGAPGFSPVDAVYGPVGNLWVVDSKNLKLHHLVNDVSPPATTATAQPSGWTLAYVTISLAATDDLSGVKLTEYRIAGGNWTQYTAPFVIDTPGVTTVSYRSTDKDGNAEAEKTVTAQIDRSGPVAKALNIVRTRAGRKAVFRIEVDDLTPTASVVIRVLKKASRRAKIVVGDVATGQPFEFKWKCTVKPGTYRWKVYATDLAGNQQRVIGSKALIVR
jgi:hypothetical protein